MNIPTRSLGPVQTSANVLTGIGRDFWRDFWRAYSFLRQVVDSVFWMNFFLQTSAASGFWFKHVAHCARSVFKFFKKHCPRPDTRKKWLFPPKHSQCELFRKVSFIFVIKIVIGGNDIERVIQGFSWFGFFFTSRGAWGVHHSRVNIQLPLKCCFTEIHEDD
jgi:hypothetical protein